MESWLVSLDLSTLAPIMLKEGLDLDSLQHVTETDLDRMGVTDVGDRRRLIGACRARSQNRALEEAVARLEAEKQELQKAHEAAREAELCAGREAAEARDTAGGLAVELRGERQRRQAVEGELVERAAELETERAAAHKWLGQARALAADVEALQAQLLAFTDAQRSSVKDSKDGLRLGLANLLEGVRQPFDAAPPRRVGGRGSGGALRLGSVLSAAKGAGGTQRPSLDASFPSSKSVSFAPPRRHRSSM
jgi:hypothetical protein